MQVWRGNEPVEAFPWAPAPGARLAAASLVRRRFPLLAGALHAQSIAPLELSFAAPEGVLGWGGRVQANLARRYANMRKLRYWSLEDGFLRSVGLGKARHTAISIVVDDLGLHHDPLVGSRLEKLILQTPLPSDVENARQVRTRLIEERLTKYNCAVDNPCKLPKLKHARRILLVDQVFGDASIDRYGEQAFKSMWQDALDEDAEIVIRDHPDVLAGLAKGVLRQIALASRKETLDGCGDIHNVLAEVDEVWTVSSQFGFEALMRGKRVVTYGMPFYAGWGLNEDRSTDPASVAARGRRSSRNTSIDELVSAALLRYPIYFDPIDTKRISIDKAIDRLCSWRREADRFKGRHVCVNISRHKRKTVRLFLDMPWSSVSFIHDFTPQLHKTSANSSRVHWGKSNSSKAAHPQITIEDGFIRSTGLGSEMAKARSLCIDPVGIYFDATRPSRLEQILSDALFDVSLLQRAGRLRESIVALHISKYNLAGERFDSASLKTEKPVALVAEQLSDDASLRFGQPIHRSSLELLAAVRKARPDHFILFKRHPDILSGTRRSNCRTLDYWEHADYVLDRKADIAWTGIAECHSATSQIGFEALLRGVTTYCYGAPFYSGWGLTVDSVETGRRRRKLSIDELVAGALILYPSYRCWRSHLPCEPEDVIRDILRERVGQA
jgi:capsular polysaccharide export protein